MTSILNKKKTQNLLRMFGKKKNNSGMIGASIVGLGLAGAALFGVVKKRNHHPNQPINNIDALMENLNLGKNEQMPNFATLTEYSKELLPTKEEEQKE